MKVKGFYFWFLIHLSIKAYGPVSQETLGLRIIIKCYFSSADDSTMIIRSQELE